MTQWLYSIAPTHFPSGGGFSITQYTLGGLYELHEKLENWWTNTNCNLPLVRYTGVTFKLYRQWETDYVFSYLNCFPMKSTQPMYMQCQPSMLMMTKNSILVKCMKESTGKKNYKIVKCRPPEQMQTKWYFQFDLVNVPLVVTLCSAASFTRYNMASTSISTTIGFDALNTKLFIYHNFQNYATTGYQPKNEVYLYGLLNGDRNLNNVNAEELIYLGAPGLMDKGHQIKQIIDADIQTWDKRVSKYFSNYKYWGNPFDATWLIQDGPRLLTTNISPNNFKTSFPSRDTKIGSKMQEYLEPLIYKCRYCPNADTGIGNKVYLVPNIRDQTNWDPLNNKNLIVEGYPLWTALFGWIDWQKQQREAQQIDINYITVIVTNFINPKLPYYVVLDSNFTSETDPQSPYIKQLTESDRQHWYPKGTFQLITLNEIGASGPGIVKLPGTNSCEAHLEYRFHFKFGGCQAPMDKVCDPATQAKYPIPNNFNATNSLQNPAMPPETFLWEFDERRQQITEKAAKRIKTCSDIKEPVFSTAGTSLQLPAATTQETSTSEDETTSEEEDQTLFQQLQHQRRRQRKYNQRIIQLLKLIKNSK